VGTSMPSAFAVFMSRARRHSAISSLRASATINVLRVDGAAAVRCRYHWASAFTVARCRPLRSEPTHRSIFFQRLQFALGRKVYTTSPSDSFPGMLARPEPRGTRAACSLWPYGR
jgi:hypothetical protein